MLRGFFSSASRSQHIRQPRFMAGGPGNPMGARARYLGSTVYRIHGTKVIVQQ